MRDLLAELSHMMPMDIQYYRNPDASKQWIGPRQTAKVIIKKYRFGPKVMLCVWWRFKGVIH